MSSLRRGDEALHHDDGTHRTTAVSTRGRALEAHERRLVKHMAAHTEAAEATPMTPFLPMADGKPMTVERLHEVFDLVKPRPNWKTRISARVPMDQATQDEIGQAVVWFAGGTPAIWEEDGTWKVLGAGYYYWVGA